MMIDLFKPLARGSSLKSMYLPTTILSIVLCDRHGSPGATRTCLLPLADGSVLAVAIAGRSLPLVVWAGMMSPYLFFLETADQVESCPGW